MVSSLLIIIDNVSFRLKKRKMFLRLKGLMITTNGIFRAFTLGSNVKRMMISRSVFAI